MRATKFIEQKDARFSLRNRAPVIWPWILVTAAWTVALLAVLTKQTYLINHSYLLTQSHLVWIVALDRFRVCSVPNRYISALAGQQLVLAVYAFLVH